MDWWTSASTPTWLIVRPLATLGCTPLLVSVQGTHHSLNVVVITVPVVDYDVGLMLHQCSRHILTPAVNQHYYLFQWEVAATEEWSLSYWLYEVTVSVGEQTRRLCYIFCRSLIRSKLDYGCVVYGSARPSYLHMLDSVQNHALRLCLGASRTSPCPSLSVEANEPPLNLRQQKFSLQYTSSLDLNIIFTLSL